MMNGSAARLDRLRPNLVIESRRRVREAVGRGVDVINLGVGDPDQPTPEHIVDALVRAAGDPANHRYPAGEMRGTPLFRKAVSSWYARRFGVNVDPDTEVMALIGSKEGSHHLALGLLDPGDTAIVPDPAYPVYEASALLAGANVVHLPLDRSRGYLPDLDATSRRQAEAAKVMWLSYPNNPTGALAPLDALAGCVAYARRHGMWLVNDNPYSTITFDGHRAPSILEVDGATDVAVEFNSLSKTYNMTGWRVGMAAGNRQLIDMITKVKEQTDTGIFTAVQLAAVAALDGPQDVIDRNVATYQRRRDLVIDAFARAGIEVDPPQATFYIWVPAPGGSGVDFANRLLDTTGVVVIPGIGYGQQGEAFVRLSLSAPDDHLEEAMSRITAAADTLLSADVSR